MSDSGAETVAEELGADLLKPSWLSSVSAPVCFFSFFVHLMAVLSAIRYSQVVTEASCLNAGMECHTWMMISWKRSS